MALISKPYTFSVGATIIAAEHNSNFDTIYADYNGNVTNANLAASFSLDESKLGQITTFGKVHGSSITNIDSLNSAAGYVPVANLDSIPNSALATVGTGSGYLVALTALSKLPALDGSNLTDLAFTCTKAAAGYINLGGVYIQWGTTGSIAADASATVTFPTAFPTACAVVQATCLNAETSYDDVFARVVSKSTTQTVVRAEDAGTTAGTRYIMWTAIGY